MKHIKAALLTGALVATFIKNTTFGTTLKETSPEEIHKWFEELPMQLTETTKLVISDSMQKFGNETLHWNKLYSDWSPRCGVLLPESRYLTGLKRKVLAFTGYGLNKTQCEDFMECITQDYVCSLINDRILHASECHPFFNDDPVCTDITMFYIIPQKFAISGHVQLDDFMITRGKHTISMVRRYPYLREPRHRKEIALQLCDLLAIVASRGEDIPFRTLYVNPQNIMLSADNRGNIQLLLLPELAAFSCLQQNPMTTNRNCNWLRLSPEISEIRSAEWTRGINFQGANFQGLDSLKAESFSVALSILELLTGVRIFSEEQERYSCIEELMCIVLQTAQLHCTALIPFLERNPEQRLFDPVGLKSIVESATFLVAGW
jgi:hypothetical protein